jgi:predicted nucleotidyltransferase
MMNERLKPILAELRERLADHYGERLVKLVLYGSQARGDAEEDSDIDVLVVLRGPVNDSEETRAMLDPIAELCLEHSVVIQWMFVSEDRYQHGKDSFMWNIRRDGVML